jgi:malate dehydrogenase (oxaloacetate-decarboxylating)(NADP+)
MLPGRTVFIGDTYVNYEPTAEQLAGHDACWPLKKSVISVSTPKVALLSHSTFGTQDTPTSHQDAQGTRAC